jgi:hypothetical protein
MIRHTAADLVALRLDAPAFRFAAGGPCRCGRRRQLLRQPVRLSGIEAQPEGIYDTPRSIEGATLDLRLTLMPELRIELGQATLLTVI